MLFVEDSKNVKISGCYKVSATYAPIKQSCPVSCELRDAGCYAKTGHVGIVNARLEGKAGKLTSYQVARIEAKAIREAFPKGIPQDGPKGGRDLRLHVSGDCRTARAARVVAEAALDYIKRGGGAVWGYTHAWLSVPRKAWEGVSILASVDDLSEVPKARKAGYAPAIVVAEHKSDKAYKLCRYKFIPCPAQTRDVTCVQCRLCFNADRLHKAKLGIAFAAHGAQASTIKRRLTVLK